MNDFEVFINDNPIEKVMSNALDCTVNKVSDIKSTWVSNEKQIGTISWENIDLKEVTSAIKDFNHYVNKQKEIAIKVNNEINEYLESKINKYLENNNLDLLDWSRHGNCKWRKNKREYFYDDVFITGVEVIFPMIHPVEDVDNLKTEYKCEIKYY